MEVTARTPRLVIAPAVHGQARPNFEWSVRVGVSPVAFARLGPEQRALTEGHPRDGLVRMWGSRANKDSVWDAVRTGDVLLFYLRRASRWRRRSVARSKARTLPTPFGTVPETWRNVLFLRQVWSLELPPAFVGALLNYKPGWYPREFHIPRPDAQRHALAPYDGVDALIASLTGESVLGTDGESTAKSRATMTSTGSSLASGHVRATTSHRPPPEPSSASSAMPPSSLELKDLYNGRCQVCDDTFPTLSGHNYSEAAHIVPLERRLPGIDFYLNIVILCATCHRKLDHGGMTIGWDNASEQVVVGWQGRTAPLLKNKHINTGWTPAGA